MIGGLYEGTKAYVGDGGLPYIELCYFFVGSSVCVCVVRGLVAGGF